MSQDPILRVATRLVESLDRPLTAQGSETVAYAALTRFPDGDRVALIHKFSQKLLETLSDGKRHDTLAVPLDPGGVAIWFVAWPGSHREAQAVRVGEYLDRLMGSARRVVEMRAGLVGFLEVDAYVREPEDENAERGILDLEIDVEYSYIPGPLFGAQSTDDPVLNTVILNPDLMSAIERQALAKFMA